MTREQRALVRIVALCRRPNHRVSRQIRMLELALEGLGVPTAARNEAVRDVIQERRDIVAQRIQANERGGHENAA